MKIQTTIKGSNGIKVISYGLLALACTAVIGVTFILYKQTEELLKDRLKERLVAIVSTGVLDLDPEAVLKIDNPADIGTEGYIDTVTSLQLIRNVNKDITYAYIFRETSDPDTFVYVADADSLNPNAEVDLNEDGIINEEDALNTPGDEYDVSEIPALRNDAPKFATTDADPVGDQWGLFLSAYAPIKYRGETVGILGIDVEVTDYFALIQRTLLPFIVFIVFLVVLLSILTVELVRVWKKQVDAVSELDRQKDELLSIVSHQLATPVSSVKWYIEMMLDGDMGKLNQEQEENLKTVQEVSSTLSELVSMILDVSRIQLGKMKVDPQELDLNSFFKEIINVIEPKAKEKNINLVKEIPDTFPVAKLDKRLTRMTVENLLSNAVKYTPENGRVEFQIKIEGNTLKCKVADTGYGIPKKEQKQIFQKLFRASNVRNNVDGNGFGLYVAKGAIESQGGKIEFSSEEGKGTIFSFELPVNN